VTGVDGREGGRDALRLANWLRRHGDGRVLAVRAFPAPGPVSAACSAPGVRSPAPHEAALEHELFDERIAVEPRAVGDTSPARALQRVAAGERAGLIVVGSSRRGRIGRVLAGDDAVATLRGAPCPVAVAPRGWSRPDGAGPLRVGVTAGRPASSRAAVLLAQALARSAGATLEVRRAGTPPAALAALAWDVDVLVVGADPPGVLRGRHAGIAAALAHETACPVVVAP
jgi:nucleotide-binding universal stress UspA family protein